MAAFLGAVYQLPPARCRWRMHASGSLRLGACTGAAGFETAHLIIVRWPFSTMPRSFSSSRTAAPGDRPCGPRIASAQQQQQQQKKKKKKKKCVELNRGRGSASI